VSDTTFEWLLDKAISWETTAQGLYEALEVAFSAHAIVSTFWHMMSVDEAHHGDVLRTIRDAMPPERLAEPVGRSEVGFVRLVDELLADAGARRIATLDDAYELAHELESSEINTVFRLLVVGTMETTAKQRLLEVQFDEHAERLVNFSLAYDPTARKKIRAVTAG